MAMCTYWGLTVVTSGYMGVMVHKLPKLEGAANGKGGLRLSLVPTSQVGGGKSGLHGIHCLRMREPPYDVMGYRIPSFMNCNLYRIAPKHVRLELIPLTAGKR